MAVFPHLGAFAQQRRKGPAAARIRAHSEGGVPASAADHGLRRQRVRQLPAERLPARLRAAVRGLRRGSRRGELPEAVVVQVKRGLFLRGQRVRLLEQQRVDRRGADRPPRLQLAAGGKSRRRLRLLRQKRVPDEADRQIAGRIPERPRSPLPPPRVAEHEVQQQMQRQPLRQVAFRKEFPPQKPRGKYGGFAVGPGGVHIALTAGQPAQRQRKRRQLRIQPAAHDGKDPLLRRHPPTSFFFIVSIPRKNAIRHFSSLLSAPGLLYYMGS